MEVKQHLKSKQTFGNGLTPKIRSAIEQVNIADIEKSFYKDYRVDAAINGSKFYAFGFAVTLNIFEELTEKFHLPFGALPPSLNVYEKKQLIFPNFPDNFCIPKGGLILKNQQPFARRSIFMKKRDDITKIDQEISKAYQAQKRSSGHFLSNIIHEWWHNVHLCSQKGKFNDNINPDRVFRKDIQTVLGSYAANSCSKMEIFAETMTKLLIQVLDSETLCITNNPLNKLANLPKSLAKFVEQELE